MRLCVYVFHSFICFLLTFIRSFLQLLVARCLLNHVQDRDGELRIREWVCLWVHLVRHPSQRARRVPGEARLCQAI